VIDALLREHDAGTLGPGVRALLLYPMNALANDQLKRLRELLADCPEITFGRYTGETVDTRSRAEAARLALERSLALDRRQAHLYYQLGQMYISDAAQAKAIDAFRRAWERQETIGFNLQDARAVWAAKDAAFRESVEQTQRRIDQQQDERHPTPELESGKQRRLQRQIKRLRALARSPVPAEAERAAALADELQVKLDAMGAQA
jgi:tetratricopeptide (TPR) repeat protein